MQPQEDRVTHRRYNGPMIEPTRRLADWSDLAALPEGGKAEVIGGELIIMNRPRAPHGRAQSILSGALVSPFDLGRGGPGGWWLVIEPDVRFGPHDIVNPDLVGWRRERLPELPNDPPIDLAPDWVCEVLSPSTAHRDRGIKADLYLRGGVEHYWLVDLSARLLEVFVGRQGNWVRLGAWGPEDSVRVPPFDAIELPLADLFPPAPEAVPDAAPDSASGSAPEPAADSTPDPTPGAPDASP